MAVHDHGLTLALGPVAGFAGLDALPEVVGLHYLGLQWATGGLAAGFAGLNGLAVDEDGLESVDGMTPMDLVAENACLNAFAGDDGLA